MNQKRYLILEFVALIFFAGTIVTDVLFTELGNPYTFKTIASLTFVLCSLTNLLLMFKFRTLNKKMFSIFLFLGQIFACLGDILLIDYFVIGAGLFAVGHIFYFIAYCFLKPFKLSDLIPIGACIAISLTVILTANLNFNGMFPLIIVYALIISCMLGKSFTLIKFDQHIGFIIYIGSLMFFLSDMFLMFNMFGSIGDIGDALCLGFYYGAEYVLAMSIAACNLILYHKQKSSKISQ